MNYFLKKNINFNFNSIKTNKIFFKFNYFFQFKFKFIFYKHCNVRHLALNFFNHRFAMWIFIKINKFINKKLILFI